MKKSLLILFALATMVGVKAQDEYQAKAFFLYNFTRLVEWPGNNGSEFVIGVVGNSPIVGQLQTLTANKRVGNLPIVIKQFKNADEVKSCNILYIAHSASSAISAIQQNSSNHNMLIVGEKKGLTNQGAAISFVLQNNRLSFDINVDNAQKYGLKVSKSLVDMAS